MMIRTKIEMTKQVKFTRNLNITNKIRILLKIINFVVKKVLILQIKNNNLHTIITKAALKQTKVYSHAKIITA